MNNNLRKQNSGKSGLIIALIILILLVFVLSLLFFSRKKTQTSISSPLIENQITVIPTQISAEQPEVAQKQKEYVEKATSQKEWEVYENTKFNYQLKYNTSWSLTGDNNSPPLPSSNNVTFSKKWPDSNDSCELSIFSDTTHDKFNQDLVNLRSDKSFYEEQQTLAGYPAILFMNLGQTTSDPMNYKYFLTNGNINLQISYNRIKTGSNAENCNDIFNLMLSSFQLTK